MPKSPGQTFETFETNSTRSCSGDKPQIAPSSKNFIVWQAATQVSQAEAYRTPDSNNTSSAVQGERNSPSPGQSAVAPKPIIPQSHLQDEQRGPSARQAACFPKRFASPAPRKTLSIHGLKHPSHITAYIKQEKLAAMSLARRGHPEEALTGFCGSMDALFSVAGSQMNHINCAAIVAALPHVSEAAQLNSKCGSHAGTREGLQVLYQRCIQSLQALLAGIHAQGCSTVLWSSAKLKLNPDTVAPGMAYDLTLRVVQLIESTEEKHRPNAQACANTVWAVAAMGHPAATAEVVDPICSYFARLTQHADIQQRPKAQDASSVLWALATMGHPAPAEVLDLVCWHFASLTRDANAKQRPNAQAVANVLWALATMGHLAAAAEVLDLVCRHFASLTRHADTKQRPTAQAAANVLWALAAMGYPAAAAEVLDCVTAHFALLIGTPMAKQQPNSQNVANVMWALGTLKHTPRDDRLLDYFCEYMHTLLGSQDQRTPDAQDIGNTLWALKQLKHAPSNDVVFAMLDCLVVLCGTPDRQPHSQDISNSLLACAELGLRVQPTGVDVMLKHLLGLHVSKVTFQAYCNAAWSLAVMGCLTISMFEAFIGQMASKSGSLELPVSARQQLHQALAWLKPSPDSKQMKAWSSLHSRLQTVAPQPPIVTLYIPGQAELRAALAMQGLQCKVPVPCGTHQADAVLASLNSTGASVILVVERPQEFITNVPSRVLGHVAFRHKMLARCGNVVKVPFYPGKSSAKSMADDIKAEVEAKTGLPLDSFRS